MRSKLAFVVAFAFAAASLALPALAQKQGGTLRIYHRDNPPSASIHEEATISTVQPFMGVFNNLVAVRPAASRSTRPTPSCPTSPRAGPGTTARPSSPSSCARASSGTTASRSRPRTCSAPGTSCTGKDTDDFRKNPRAIWWHNLKEVTVNGDHEVTFILNRPQPSFLALFASGYTPGLSLPRVDQGHAHQADRHRALQVRRVQAQRVDQVRAQPRLLEEGQALPRRHRVAGDREPLDAHPGLRRRRVRHDVLDAT